MSALRIALIAKPGHANTGVGRYVIELQAALENLGHEVLLVHPVVPLPAPVVNLVRRTLGWDLHAFFENYPIWARYPEADVYHLSSQNLATLMLVRRPPGPTVVTVHDIIPWLVRGNPELRVYNHRLAACFDRLALKGVVRVDGWVADSSHSAQTSAETTDLGDCEVNVIPLGVA